LREAATTKVVRTPQKPARPVVNQPVGCNTVSASSLIITMNAGQTTAGKA
jgi:hypothetical protein